MKWSWRIGSILGIPIKLHVTFILLLIFITVSGGARGELGRWIGLAFVLTVFGSVLLHELGHSMVAQLFNIQVKNITLLPIGGVAHIEQTAKGPWKELAIAVAGPATSFLLAGIFYLLAFMWDVPATIRGFGAGASFIGRLYAINLILGLFNLLPAFPMDGGRLLKGALGMWFHPLKATQIAVNIGQALAIAMFFVGIFYSWWLALIAIFIYIGAEGEERSQAMHTSLRDVPVRTAMIQNIGLLRPDQTLSEAADLFCSSFQGDFPVVDKDRVVGIVTKDILLEALHKRDAAMQVGEIMRRDFRVASDKMELAELLTLMHENDQTVIPILDNGKLVGLITLEQIGKYNMLCSTRRS